METIDLMTKMVFDRWQGALRNFDSVLAALSDADLEREIAPGKNRGLYLLGHLIAVHDDMLVLLDLGERQYPGLQEPFLKQPDKAVTDLPAAAQLRKDWSDQCAALATKFAQLAPADWLHRHTAVPAGDFEKEPHRNKLNIIITRTTHLTYHTGQLVLLKK